jgi:protease-4
VNNLILGITVRNRDTIAFIIILAIIIVFFVLLYIASGDRVGVLEVNGVIYDSRPFMEDLKKFLNNSSVKAIVVRINSPGGSVGSSQEMYTALKRAKEELPVVVSMADVAASGGYYLAIAADSIIANPGTTTGSIGVIAQLPQFYRLMDKIGIDQEVIKSGKFKDTGNPYREMTKAERDYLQGWVDDTYEQFVEAVAEERGFSVSEVKEMADGRVYTGRQALDLGLIDKIGDFQDAVDIAGAMGGIKGKPQILERKKKKLTLFDILFGDIEETLSRLAGDHLELQYIMP